MTEAPNYYIWHPRLRADGILVFNVTPGEQSQLASRSKRLITEFVRSLNISSKVESFDVLAYRSSYQGEPDAEEWEDRLPINWRITARLSKPPARLPKQDHEYTATTAFDADSLDEPEPEEIGALVIADFETTESAEKARSKIKGSVRIQKMARKRNAPAPDFERVELGKSLIQEQIYLGKFPEPFIKSGAKYLYAVERICRANGGLTNFDERTAERGELFDSE